jgi:glutaredoxin-related protein
MLRRMSAILYYSRYCSNCEQVLKYMSRCPAKDSVHFVCVDERQTSANGAVHVKLKDGQELLLPPTITKVPALLLLDRGHQVVFGEDITKHFEPAQTQAVATATASQGEPAAFAFGGSGGSIFGVASDSYSFLDQSAEQMAAKGEGGLRQTHHYAQVNHRDSIQTPPDTYEGDKVSPKAIEQLERKRDELAPQT